MPDLDLLSRDLDQVGYQPVTHVLGGSAGMAILSNRQATEAEPGFGGGPLPDYARVIAATVSGISVSLSTWSTDAGSTIPPIKPIWMVGWPSRPGSNPPTTRGYRWSSPVVSISLPHDRDVPDRAAWTGRINVSEAERARIRALFDLGAG